MRDLKPSELRELSNRDLEEDSTARKRSARSLPKLSFIDERVLSLDKGALDSIKKLYFSIR